MATEICASRLLAPYYGSSTVVWANIIGLILASLSLGLLARRPPRRPAPVARAAGRPSCSRRPRWWPPSPSWRGRSSTSRSRGIDTLSTGAVVGSFAASLALFAPPVVLLGMVTPFAIRLAATGVARRRPRRRPRLRALHGRQPHRHVRAGPRHHPAHRHAAHAASARRLIIAARRRCRCWRAAGSPLGSSSAPSSPRLLAVPPGVVKAAGRAHPRGGVALPVHPGGAARATSAASTSTRATPSTPCGAPTPCSPAASGTCSSPRRRCSAGRRARVAMLGNAAGTTARAFGVYYPEARIDGVEIDPAVSAVGRRYFGLGDNPRLTVHTADARPFLRGQRTRATTSSSSTPTASPTCPSTWRRASSSGSAGSGSRPAASSPSTSPRCPATTAWREAVAGTLARRVPPGRHLAGAALQPVRRGPDAAAPAGGHDRPPAGGARATSCPARASSPATCATAAPAARPWTDDRAPVEWITDRMIAAYALRGAGDRGAPPAHGARLSAAAPDARCAGVPSHRV